MLGYSFTQANANNQQTLFDLTKLLSTKRVPNVSPKVPNLPKRPVYNVTTTLTVSPVSVSSKRPRPGVVRYQTSPDRTLFSLLTLRYTLSCSVRRRCPHSSLSSFRPPCVVSSGGRRARVSDLGFVGHPTTTFGVGSVTWVGKRSCAIWLHGLIVLYSIGRVSKFTKKVGVRSIGRCCEFICCLRIKKRVK